MMSEENNIQYVAAQPQDHLPPTTKDPKTVTVDGITVTIDPRKLTDFRIIDEMYDITYKDGGLKIVGLLRRILGQAQYDQVLDQLADRDDVVDPERVNGFLTKLFNELSPNS